MRFTEDPKERPIPSEGPTVLDWFKSLLRLDPIAIPEADQDEDLIQQFQPAATPAAVDGPEPVADRIWQLTPARLRVPAALFLVLVAQLNLAQRSGILALNLLLYGLGLALMVWALLAGDFVPVTPQARTEGSIQTEYNWRLLAIGMALALVAFLTAGGNQFRSVTLLTWVGAMVTTVVALWNKPIEIGGWRSKLGQLAQPSEWRISFTRWHLLLLVAILVVAFFRLNQLASVPFEMWSDQAEKLLDVRDVLEGDTKIFFPRNSGREAVEFYWAAAVSQIFNTGLSFMTLKIVSVSAGLLALPFIYLLGKELGGRRVGLFALLMAGMAFWPTIISRAGLRMPLNEMFVAPAMYFLVRGLRRRNRNDFLFSGLAIGIGLQGYSGARILPVVILLGWLLYLVHNRSSESRRNSLVAFSALVLVSVLAALPLLRFLVDQPDLLLYRTLTRMGTLEQEYQLHPVLQLAKNMWNILIMFAWDNGGIWVVTVPNRPALDWITGGLFHIGLVLTAVNYVRRRKWHSLYLLLALPLLLLPSALALAFPNENPAPNRVTGAIVPVFILAAIGLDTLYRWAERQIKGRSQLIAMALVGILLIGVGVRNHRLVFTTYAADQRASAWNNTEAGAVMRGFDASIGDFDNVYFVAYPFWLDSRLAAIEAGAPLRDYSLWPEDVPNQQLDPAAYHLYIIKPEDVESMDLLADLHPEGNLSFYQSEIAGRDFYLFLVPPRDPVERPLEP